jgi:Second Longin domain of FUZ, MON1 and HPS1
MPVLSQDVAVIAGAAVLANETQPPSLEDDGDEGGNDDELPRVSHQSTGTPSSLEGRRARGPLLGNDGDKNDGDEEGLSGGRRSTGHMHSCIKYVVMTDAGKPVFYHRRGPTACRSSSRHEHHRGRDGDRAAAIDPTAKEEGNNEEEVSKMCSLLRAICGSLQYSNLAVEPASDKGDETWGETIRCVQSGSQLLVFLTIGAVTLVAMATGRDPAEHQKHCPTAAFLRVQLEYLYGYILATLTAQIQIRLELDPSYDLRLDLGVSTESALAALLDEMESRPEPFLTCSIPVFFPLDANVREVASRALKVVGDVTPNTILAFLMVHSEILTLVQPGYVAVPVSDLLLLRHVVTRQERNALDRRLWIPVCLPRLHSGGYLHVYIHSLGDVTSTSATDPGPSPLLLVFVGSAGSTDQFNLFRRAEASVRAQLGLPSRALTASTAASGAPGILDCRSRPDDDDAVAGKSREMSGVASSPAIPQRRVDDRRGSDEDYVDASGDGDRMIKFVVINGDVSASSPETTALGPCHEEDSSWSLLSHIRSSDRGSLLDDCLQATGALHFLLRLNVPIRDTTDGRGRRGNAASTKAAVLPQSISSPLEGSIGTVHERETMWIAYQRLALRLRIGSATIEATNDAMDRIALSNIDQSGEKDGCWSIVRLLEQPPPIEGICYITESCSTHLALNGSDFELYVPGLPAVSIWGERSL